MNLRRRGLEAVLICTDAFLSMAEIQCVDLGCPDLVVVAVPHPIGGATEPEIVEKAKIAAEALKNLRDAEV